MHTQFTLELIWTIGMLICFSDELVSANFILHSHARIVYKCLYIVFLLKLIDAMIPKFVLSHCKCYLVFGKLFQWSTHICLHMHTYICINIIYGTPLFCEQTALYTQDSSTILLSLPIMYYLSIILGN